MNRLPSLALSALCLLGSSAWGAGVYKWVDDKGITHYDDQSLRAERLTRQAINKREIPAEVSAFVPPAYAVAVRRRCTDLKERALAYGHAAEIYGSDPAGNTYRLSPTQMQLERAALEREKQRYCRTDAAAKLLNERRQAARAERSKAKP